MGNVCWTRCRISARVFLPCSGSVHINKPSLANMPSSAANRQVLATRSSGAAEPQRLERPLPISGSRGPVPRAAQGRGTRAAAGLTADPPIVAPLASGSVSCPQRPPTLGPLPTGGSAGVPPVRRRRGKRITVGAECVSSRVRVRRSPGGGPPGRPIRSPPVGGLLRDPPRSWPQSKNWRKMQRSAGKLGPSCVLGPLCRTSPGGTFRPPPQHCAGESAGRTAHRV